VIASAAGPDLIDINYGCPVKQVACRGAGAGLLRDIPKMVSITEAIVKSTHLPVTVKTRLGWDDQTKNVEEVAERLQDIGIKALTIHGRTRVQMYKGDADWELIGKIKNNPRIQIPIFGNGDIDTPEKAALYKNTYGVNEIKHFLNNGTHLPPPDVQTRIHTAKMHLQKSLEWKGSYVGIVEMRRHYAPYFKGLENFKPFRTRLVTAGSGDEIEQIFSEIESYYGNQVFSV
jgi:nifR3 family TIM-barrel protein